MSTPKESFPFPTFESEWQRRWASAGIFEYEPPPPGTRKWFIMDLPPFANGRLHLGHVRNYVMADVSARFRRMNGFLVLYTSGFDSFGLPNELAAIQAARHPKELAEEVIAQMRHDFIRLGLSHDTRRVIGYHGEEYYKWVQWVFLRLFENGLAYRQRTPVSWCSTCNSSLADSLSEGGLCWRCKTPAETRTIPQWLIRESDFAEELLASLDSLANWPVKIRRIHADWIGRKEGAVLYFRIAESPDQALNVFFPNPAAIPAVAAILISPDHELVDRLTGSAAIDPAIRNQLSEARRAASHGDHSRGLSSRTDSRFTGIPLGVSASHPLLPNPVPIIALAEMDLRNFDGVAPLCPSMIRADAKIAESLGVAIEQPPASELPAGHWLTLLQQTGSGTPSVRYRLRDWDIARQRYWGPPVPIVHCNACGEVAVPDQDLPVRLPFDVDLSSPSPLAGKAEFVNTPCPRCGGPARRDTDTLEAYSSPWWYRWNAKGSATESPFNDEEARTTLPVDLMIGGEDQARTCFFHIRMMARALHRIGVTEEVEPVERLIAIGMVKSQGRKMSKSEGNVVDPFVVMRAYGVDALRFAVMGAAAPDSDMNWDDALVHKAHQFLLSVWQFFDRNRDLLDFSRLSPEEHMDTTYSMAQKLEVQLCTALSRITAAFENHQFHLAASNAVSLFDRIEGYEKEALKRRKKLDIHDEQAVRYAARCLLLALTPLSPHIAEELWHRCRASGFIAQAPWPAQMGRVQKYKAGVTDEAIAASGRPDC